MTYKMNYISHENKYVITPLGANKNIDRSKIHEVIKYGTAWIANDKQLLKDHAKKLMTERIEVLKREITRLEQRAVIG